MAFIAFAYSVRGVEGVFTGKTVFGYISDDHEGLDVEAKRCLLRGLNEFRFLTKKRPLRSKDVNVGVIGFADGRTVAPPYSSSGKAEAKIFDFYYEEKDDYGYKVDIYVNGKKIIVPSSSVKG